MHRHNARNFSFKGSTGPFLPCALLLASTHEAAKALGEPSQLQVVKLLLYIPWVLFFAAFLAVIITVVVITERAKKSQSNEGDGKFASKLRSAQDGARNAGWRIQHISWLEDGKVEIIPNTRITTVMGLGAMLGFLAAAALLVFRLVAVQTGIALALGSLLIGIFSRFLMARTMFRGWKRIDATCVDSEISEFTETMMMSQGGTRTVNVWRVRVLCRFNFDGTDYETTPDISENLRFRSEAAAGKYLSKLIRPNQRCLLWIDAGNPLHTMLERPLIV